MASYVLTTAEDGEDVIEQRNGDPTYYSTSFDRRFYIVNPGQWDPPGGAYKFAGRGDTGLWVLWFGQHSPTLVAVFADSLDDALEEAAGWLEEHAPGVFYDQAYMKDLYDEAREELGPDAEDYEVEEAATADMTYTESGYLGSDEWGIWSDPHHTPPALYLGTAQLYEREYEEPPAGFEKWRASLAARPRRRSAR